MGRLYKQYLVGEKYYVCSNCKTHLAYHDQIFSKDFQGRHGKAYLFNDCVNIIEGRAEERILKTGMYIVVDIFCATCDLVLGWKYVNSEETNQRYKVGKVIIERVHMKKECWH